MSTFGRASHIIFWGAIAWLCIAAFLALQFWPHLPASSSGWAAFIAFGPPLYVVAEAAAEWAWSSRAGRAISHHPSSAVRILLGVVICLAAGVLAAVAVPRLVQSVAVDRCLDAGGAFNYSAQSCEGLEDRHAE